MVIQPPQPRKKVVLSSNTSLFLPSLPSYMLETPILPLLSRVVLNVYNDLPRNPPTRHFCLSLGIAPIPPKQIREHFRI